MEKSKSNACLTPNEAWNKCYSDLIADARAFLSAYVNQEEQPTASAGYKIILF